MNRIIGTAALLFLSAISLSGCGSASSSQSSSSTAASTGTAANAQIAQVTATNFKWTMDKTTFKAGTPIEFDVKGEQGAHGFMIDGTNVSQMITAGSTQKVTWTPTKPGTYTIRCNVMCGSGHGTMSTTFTVE